MKEIFEIDTIVVGAGVVGLAVARALALAGREVWLLERETEIGMQTSSRNSEVIHAGIYYPQGSLKAKLCVEGKGLLYDYCDKHQISVNRCGKLIVAVNEDQIETLKEIREKASRNGVNDLEWIDRDRLRELEPDLKGEAALLSPSTGTVDSHNFMVQLLADLEAAGGQLVLDSALKALSIDHEGIRFEILGQNTEVRAKQCINSAGLQALDLFRDVDGFPQDKLPTPHFAKGSYFAYSGKVSFQHLIYPVPEPGGLGIHLTLDQSGMAKFGPDVQWVEGHSSDDFDYQVDASKREKFANAVKTYWPALDPEKLVPDYSGMRPKLSAPGEAAADFMIQSEREHGVKGLVNLFGIESPGLTSSLAIAEEVVKLLDD